MFCINNCSSAKQVDLSVPIQVEISMFAASSPQGADGHFSALLCVLNRPACAEGVVEVAAKTNSSCLSLDPLK